MRVNEKISSAWKILNLSIVFPVTSTALENPRSLLSQLQTLGVTISTLCSLKVGFAGCCCCSAFLSSCNRTASNANLLDDPHTFHYQDYFVIGGIRTCLGVSDDLMFLWISSNSCPLNLLLVRSHQAEIIIVKRLIQGRNNATRVRVEPRPFDQGRRKNDAFTHSATLPIYQRVVTSCNVIKLSNEDGIISFSKYRVFLSKLGYFRLLTDKIGLYGGSNQKN